MGAYVACSRTSLLFIITCLIRIYSPVRLQVYNTLSLLDFLFLLLTPYSSLYHPLLSLSPWPSLGLLVKLCVFPSSGITFFSASYHGLRFSWPTFYSSQGGLGKPHANRNPFKLSGSTNEVLWSSGGAVDPVRFSGVRFSVTQDSGVRVESITILLDAEKWSCTTLLKMVGLYSRNSPWDI